jgi:outer membrane cobalamin receptor
MRPAARFLVLPVLFFLYSSVPVLAGPVTGTVVDPEGKAVGGARVLLVRGAQVVATTITDARGEFEVQAPEGHAYELRVALEGFRAAPMIIDAGAERRDIGRITLDISAIAESLVVSAAHVDVPLSTTSSSVTVVSGDDLRARQVEGLADALRLVPGLTVAATGGRGAVTGLFPRGGESDYSLVVIDGVPANAFGGSFDFGHVPTVNVDRIEIVRGPQSALYGSNAIGSVVRIVTRRGGPLQADASVGGGSFSTVRAGAAASGGTGPWTWGAALDGETSDGAEGETTRSGETVSNDDYARHSISGGGGWTGARGTAVRADVRYLENERGFPGPFGSDPGGTFSGVDTVSRGGDTRWLTSLSAASPIRERVRVHGQLSHGRLDSTFVSPFGDSESWSRRTSARIQADIGLRQELETSAGFELQRERAGSTFITARGAREVPVERGLSGLFAEVRWNRASRLFVTGGLRAERITRDALAGDEFASPPRPDFSDETIISTNPKIAAAWFVRMSGVDFTKLRGSAGTGIRPPDAFEIAFTDNPSLKPERSRSFDAGIDHTWFGARAHVEATAFLNRYDDLIVAVGSFQESSRFQTDNISNARSRGLELAGSTRARLAPLDLHLRVSYTLLDTEIMAVDQSADAPSPFTAGDSLLRRPRHQFGAELLVSAGRVTAFLQGAGRGRFRDVDPSFGTFGGVFEATGFAVWNAGASWRLPAPIEIFGRITNILDRGYEEALGFPALGRGLYAGVRLVTGR